MFRAGGILCSRLDLLVCCLGPVSPSETPVSKEGLEMFDFMINFQTMFVIPADMLSCHTSAQLIPPTPHLQHLL